MGGFKRAKIVANRGGREFFNDVITTGKQAARVLTRDKSAVREGTRTWYEHRKVSILHGRRSHL